jgi:hypothetical protein
MEHLHHLLFKRMAVSRLVPSVPAWWRHGASSGVIWTMVASCQLIAVPFLDNTMVLVLFSLLGAILYHLIYKALFEKAKRSLLKIGLPVSSSEYS